MYHASSQLITGYGVILSVRDASGNNILMAIKTGATYSIAWQFIVASGSKYLHQIQVRERSTSNDQDILFGCGQIQTFPSSPTSSAVQVYRAKIGPTASLTNLAGFTVEISSNVYCKGIQATTDTTLYIHSVSHSANTANLLKITFDDSNLGSISYETRQYKSFGPETAKILFHIRPLRGIQTEPEVIFGGNNVWTYTAKSYETNPNVTSIAWLDTTEPSKQFLTPFAFVSVNSGQIANADTTFSRVQTSTSFSFTANIPSFKMNFPTNPTVSSVILQPSYNSKDLCLIETEPSRVYTPATTPTFTYYIPNSILIDATSTPSFTPGITGLDQGMLTDCLNVCQTYRFDTSGALLSPPIVQWDSGSGGVKISTNNPIYDMQTYDVVLRGTLPISYRTNCVYYQSFFSFQAIYVILVPPTIATKTYYLGDPLMTVTLPAFPLNNPAYASNPIFAVIYEILDANTNLPVDAPIANFMTNVDNIQRSFNIQSDLSVDKGTYSLKINAWFYGFPFTIYSVPFTLQMIAVCGNNQITLSNGPGTLYYLIEDGSTVTGSWTAWSTVCRPSICGGITFSIVPGTIPEIQPDLNAQKILITRVATTVARVEQMKLRGEAYNGGTTPIFIEVAFDVYFISNKISFITPTDIPDQEYIVTDPAKSFTITPFQNSDSRFAVVYDMVQVMPDKSTVPYNQSLVSFDPVNIIVTIKAQTDNTLVKEYIFKIIATFNVSINYQVSSSFKLNIRHQCVKSILTPSPIPNPILYNVSMPELRVPFKPWKTTYGSLCQPLIYSARLISGSSLPNFIEFDTKSLAFMINTNNPYSEGVHSIVLTGIVNHPPTAVPTLLNITVLVQCAPIWIKSKMPTRPILTYFINSGMPLEFQFIDFETQPKCMTTPPNIIYDFQLATVGKVPKELTLIIEERHFSIKANQRKMIQGRYDIVVRGRLAWNKAAVAEFRWVLIVAELPESIVGAPREILLNPLNIRVEIMKQASVESIEFANIKEDDQKAKEYHIVTNDNMVMQFTQLNEGKLLVSPGEKDSGTYVLFLVSKNGFFSKEYSTNVKYAQKVTIEVFGGTIKNKLSAVIKQITRNGIAYIQFSESIIIPQNITKVPWILIMELSVKDRQSSIINKNKIIQWNATEFRNSDMLKLEIQFKEPAWISIPKPEYLQINFMNGSSEFFVSQRNSFLKLPELYNISGLIPKQLNDLSSIKLNGMTQSMQNTLDSALSKSCYANLFIAFTLNTIYRSINALQVVFLLPLMNVALNGNIELIYVLFETNTNKNFDCSSKNTDRPGEKSITKEEGFYSFNDETPFSDEFEAEGYESHQMIANIGPTINNIQMVIFLTLGSMILLYIMIHILEKNFYWFKLLTDMLYFSYIEQFLIGHSLRLLTFSLINLTLPLKMDTSSFLSYSLSLLFAISIFGLALFCALIVYMTPQDQLFTMKQNNPRIQVLFKDLRPIKSALLFWPVFMLRRFALATIVTALKDHQAFQLTFLVVQSSMMTGYLANVLPFESNFDNFLEIFNELMILATILHLYPFSDAFDSNVNTRNTAGWTFLGFVLAQILINLLIKLVAGFLKVKPSFLKWLKKREQNKVKKEDLLTFKNLISVIDNGGLAATGQIENSNISQINFLEINQNYAQQLQVDDITYHDNNFKIPNEELYYQMSNQDYREYGKGLPMALNQMEYNLNRELPYNPNQGCFQKINPRDFKAEDKIMNDYLRRQQQDVTIIEEEDQNKNKKTLIFLKNGFESNNVPFFMRK